MLAERARLTESRQQLAALRRGLLRVVPRAALALLTPEALERAVWYVFFVVFFFDKIFFEKKINIKKINLK